MKVVHFVKVRFDKRRIDIDQAWLNKRYVFFRDNTLKRLREQTNKDWVLWVNCQDGMQEQIDELIKLLESSPINVVYTFGDGPVPVEVVGVYPFLQEELKQSDYVYVTRIDSDDLYSSDAIQIARDVKPTVEGRVEASMFCRGYLYDVNTGRLGVYKSPSTPFHTIMIPTPAFLNPDRYRDEVWSKVGDHSAVNRQLPMQTLPDWKFTVLIHGNNFISNFDYARETDQWNDPNWTIDKFMSPPVVFDVDDHCDEWNCLPEMLRLKEQYPHFKCTLFTIPEKISGRLLNETAEHRDWIEIAVHGIRHHPNEEMKSVSYAQLYKYLTENIDHSIYTKGFRPPGWAINSGTVRALNDAGYWCALHMRDRLNFGKMCRHGYYACGDRYPYWHAHSHGVCGNGIQDDIDKLLKMWPKEQKFGWVSESIIKKPK
jgi:hypothetical protein